jgi:hypothetical protein
MPDPATAAGKEDEVMSVFRDARDEIAHRLLALLRRWKQTPQEGD